MNKSNENRLSMLHAVLAVCTKYTATWTGVLGYKKAQDELVVNVGSIVAASAVQETNMKGAALDKRFKRQAMTVKTVEVARAVFAYAEDIGDLVLREKMNLSPNDLNRKRDAVVQALAQGVRDVANGLIASLGDYGLVAADITALQAAIDAYANVVSAPRNAAVVRKGATAEIDTLMKDSMKILNNRMDKLMPEFETSAPEFFQEYFAARIIVDNGGAQSEPIALAA
ncbi:MAG: hypothetical protein IPJ85_07830 [Flavobacteriales bacterium]|nr:hypothetical protein [Flavobacteriales bacterium]